MPVADCDISVREDGVFVVTVEMMMPDGRWSCRLGEAADEATAFRVVDDFLAELMAVFRSENARKQPANLPAAPLVVWPA